MITHLEESLTETVGEALKVIQNRILFKTTYFGVTALKNPMDFWVYQEIIFEHKPDVIVEIGNNHGGSTLALAHFLDSMQQGRVIGIDIDHSKVPKIVSEHPRITLIEDTAVNAFQKVKELVKSDEKVLIIEDSSHTYENTLAVLRIYEEFVKKGDYLIIEDSICHHGLDVGPSPGPYEAIETFIKENDSFVIDREKESFFITWNPKGFLKRIKG